MLMLLTGWPSRVNDAEGRLIPLAQQDRRKTAWLMDEPQQWTCVCGGSKHQLSSDASPMPEPEGTNET
jgi:hypothetical protein